MNQRRFWIVLISIHALFMYKQIYISNSLIQDSKEYLFAADNLIQHQTLYSWNLNQGFNPDWLSKRPILYPALLSLFKLLSFGNLSFFYILIYGFQNIASLLSIYFCLKIVELKQIKINYFQALFFLIFSVSQFIYSNLVMSEVYLQLCMISTVYILIQKPINQRRLFYIALILIVGMSLKPVFMLTAFIFPIVWIIWNIKSWKWTSFILTCIPLFYFLTISTWNKQRTGYFHYSSISNINLLHYNTYTMLMYRYGPEIADSIVDKIYVQAKLKDSYAKKEQFIKAACKTEILNNAGTYSLLHFRGIIFSLLDPGRFDITQFFGMPHKKNFLYESNKEGGLESIIRLLMNPLGLLLLVLGLFNVFRTFIGIKFLFRKEIPIALKLIIIIFPIYILGLTGPIGASRFFMPLIPFTFLMFLFVTQKKIQKIDNS